MKGMMVARSRSGGPARDAGISTAPQRPAVTRLPGNQALLRGPDAGTGTTARARMGRRGDVAEQEADTAARHAAQGPAVSSPALPRPALSASLSSASTAPGSALPAAAGGSALAGSRPLAPAERAFFEPRLGRSFGHVRIHDGPQAHAAATGLDAQAFTFGRDISFAKGAFRPDQPAGRQLIAHELAHVAQQTDAPALAGAGSGDGAPRLSTVSPHIQRVELSYDDGPDAAGNTARVLQELNAAGAKATFYLVGKRVAQSDNWKTVFAIAAAGHWIGNHAYDWNDTKDDHSFLHGSAEERAVKILNTEWAIRDALMTGKADAQKNNKWTTLPQSARDYIDDLIAHGTGRFRTPGFKSKFWNADGRTTHIAIQSANAALSAAGLRPLRITEVSTLGVDNEGVDVDPEDWRSGRTKGEIEKGVADKLDENSDSILLHSRIGATAQATPAILADIKSRGYTYDPTVQGQVGAMLPGPGFAQLKTISNPSTPAEIAAAKAFMRRHIPSSGGFLAGALALGIFRMAQSAGKAEVDAFAAEIKATTVQTSTGPVPLSNWMMENPEWRLFAGLFENWMTNKPFPKIPGLTI